MTPIRFVGQSLEQKPWWLINQVYTSSEIPFVKLACILHMQQPLGRMVDTTFSPYIPQQNKSSGLIMHLVTHRIESVGLL